MLKANIIHLVIALLIPFCTKADQTQAIVIEGKYQNRNIFVVNSLAESGVGYCAYEVSVNGHISSDDVNSSAFEIDLSNFNLTTGDDVIITIKHKNGCKPQVLNPGVLQPQPTFEVENIQLDENGLLKWRTTGESGPLPYDIEVYRWSKWVKVGEVAGNGIEGTHVYKFSVKLHSGENKVRVTQKNDDGKYKRSDAVSVTSSKEPPKMTYQKKSGTISFSEETSYEVWNKFGKIIKRGFGSEIDMSQLEKGKYYIFYDSVTEEFEK